MQLTKIGFTGTRGGMTPQQQAILICLLKEHMPFSEFHHGDCIGADKEAHKIVHRYFSKTIQIVIHPSDMPEYRAYCSPGLVLDEKPPLERNHDIVDCLDILIACPKGEEVLRSGTWSTVRYAKKKQKPITIIYPQGITKSIP